MLNAFFGIYLKNATDCAIRKNVITGKPEDEIHSGNAIHIWKSKRIEVVNNQLSNHRDGIYLEFVDQSLFKKNLSKNNMRYGMHFMFSNYDTYEDNTFEKMVQELR